MRILESVQFVVVVAALALPVVFGRRLKRGRMAVALIAAMSAQLVIEGYRWQLLPLEVGTLLLAAGDALWDDRRFRGAIRLRRALLGIVGLAAVSFLPLVLPVPNIPTPTGPFDVGTTTVVLEDPDREELFGLPEPEEDAADESEPVEIGDPRRLVVQAWYPALPDVDQRALWNPDVDVLGSEIAGRLGLPGFALGHTRLVLSHSYSDAPPIEGRFPVVLASHDWAGFRTDALMHYESLASHGFIVLVPDHTYASLAVRFPDDGSVVYLDPRVLPESELEEEEEEYLEAAETLVDVMAGDLSFIADRLVEGDAALELIAGHADIEQIGVYGHGVGGGAAARMCLEDDRCDAVLATDPWVDPIPNQIVAREFQVPNLLMRSDDVRDTPNDRRLRGMAERAPSLSYWISIDGTGHNDFTMAPLLSPFAASFGWKGEIEAERVLPIVDSYVVAFFERFLLGVGGSVLDQPPPPEVDLELIT